MAIKLIVLEEEPECTIDKSDIWNSGLADRSDRIVESDSVIPWLMNALELDGAESVEDGDGNQMVMFTKTFRDRYFNHYWDEFHRWIEKAAQMDFDDFKSWRGSMKFDDAERWFNKPNDIYVWYAGWYATLTDFLRNIKDDETFYFGNAFEIS